jgi:hypothetical protein
MKACWQLVCPFILPAVTRTLSKAAHAVDVICGDWLSVGEDALANLSSASELSASL